jgi:Fic family protein
MASHLPIRWEPNHQGLSRLDRKGCIYDANLPDLLEGWNLSLPGDVAADIADAEAAVRSLGEAGTRHASLEGLARFLLRAESVASSKIEGLSAASRRLAKAETALKLGGDPADQMAVEILGNIAAMESAVELGAKSEQIELEHLLAIHRTLMERSPTPELGGQIRKTQNWIGGSSQNPCAAAFVPPPAEHLPPLLADLLAYINGDEHSPLVQAAIAHAQFETLHPFADGNGRTGRALIHIILRRRGLATRFVPPISLVLATWSKDYVAGLTQFRHTSDPQSPARSQAVAPWLRTISSATQRACHDAELYSEEINQITNGWREDMGRVRANSSSDLLLRVLPGAPIVSVESASALIGRSKARTTDAIHSLVQSNVLRQRNVGRKRDRVYEASQVLDLFTKLERALASPTGDTQTAKPNRAVPDRPKS